MTQPYALSFGPWVPDGADLAIAMPYQYSPTTIPLADCLNVYWADQGYRSLKALVGAGSALSSQCLGAATVLDSSGTAHVYAGNSSDLFTWNGSGFTNVSKSAGAYSGSAHWQIVLFGGCVVAANGVNDLQDMTVGGANFADIPSAPIGNVLGVIGQFLFVGDLTSPTAYPYRVQWCGIGDPTNWPTPLTDAAIAAQSSYEDLTQAFGRVLFIGAAPGALQGVILSATGITRATYQGGDVVFDFVPVTDKRGVIARGAAVQAGGMTHFIATDGFHMTDGMQVVPTGSSTDGSVGLDKWFWSNVNTAALGAVQAAYDSTLKCVLFAIPTGSNTLPDTLLLLNPTDRRWTRASVSSEMMFTDLASTNQHVVSFFDQTHKYGALSGTAPNGYVETYDGSFLDGRVRDVVEVQPNIVCTDTPTVRVGYRESSQDSITYTSDNTQDSFTRRVTFDPPPAGRLVRVRCTSAAAQALNGATLFTEMGGV